MKYRTLSMILSMTVLALVACKKDKGKPQGEPAPASAPKPVGEVAKGGCPAGLSNPNDLGVCIKLIDGLTQNDDSVGHGGNEKVAAWTADGSTSIHIRVEDYSSMFWQSGIDELVAGGGFGGTLIDQAKVGSDGITANFSADSGTTERRIRITRIHNDDIRAECWAEKEVMSTVGPKIDDVLGVCSNVTFAK